MGTLANSEDPEEMPHKLQWIIITKEIDTCLHFIFLCNIETQ